MQPTRSFLLLLCSLSLSACLSSVGLTDSGFLSSEVRLSPAEGERARATWTAPDADFGRYHALLVDPLEIRLTDASQNQLNSKQEALLEENFRRYVLAGLPEGFTLAQEPGPDVLRLRTALTEVDTTNMLVNWFTGLVILWPLDYGGATFELELQDSSSGRPLAAMVNADRATAWNAIQAMTRIGHACQAAEETATWATDKLRPKAAAAPPESR